MWHDQLYARQGLEQQHHTQSGSMETLITDSLAENFYIEPDTINGIH